MPQHKVYLFSPFPDPSIQSNSQISALGPGSNNLLPKLTDPSRGPERTLNAAAKGPRDLNVHEWNILVDVFKKWPFRPEVRLPSFHITCGILISVIRTSGLSHSSRLIPAIGRFIGTFPLYNYTLSDFHLNYYPGSNENNQFCQGGDAAYKCSTTQKFTF